MIPHTLMSGELTNHRTFYAVKLSTRILTFITLSSLVIIASGLLSGQKTPSNKESFYPGLSDFWEGAATWVIEINDTGLPVGESDTLQLDDGAFISYLHASTKSAEIFDSCGDPVEFPGCITAWESDTGERFNLSDAQCAIACKHCPCTGEDKTWQQQYPRTLGLPDGTFYLVAEHGAMSWQTRSQNGDHWDTLKPVAYTGEWLMKEYACPEYMRIGEHPFFDHYDDCMAGGPPGLVYSDSKVYLLIGMGQNPGHAGCYWSWPGSRHYEPCENNPLLTGAETYGPIEVKGEEANPYFDFRYITSFEIVEEEDYYYILYEGIRGPSLTSTGRDDQFALGLARAKCIDCPWEPYPDNPIIMNVADNWGIGHADLIVVEGQTFLYTATLTMTRARYTLHFN